MRAVIQRVMQASVTIDGQLRSSIGSGLLVLAAVENADTEEDLRWLSAKIAGLRIFCDEQGIMNLSVRDIGGEVLVVSQFTLYASTKKGNRPSYIRSAKPEFAADFFARFVLAMEEELGRPVQTGQFGADMKVSLLNDGPVTIIIDTKTRE